MTTVAPDRTADHDAGATPPDRRPSRWLVPLAAAAAVVGIAAATVWGQGLLPGDAEESSSYAGSLDLPEGQGIVLDAPGWTVDALGGDGIMFRNGDADLEVTEADEESVAAAFALYAEFVATSQQIVADADLSDVTVAAHPRTGEHFSLRWILDHLLEEYARHNGHADLLREAIDGVVGE